MATIAHRHVVHRKPVAALPRNTPQRVCRAVGWMMMVIGILGFAAPMLMGMHLGFVHSMIYISAGAGALWLGQNGTTRRAVQYSMVGGTLFALLGIAGLVFGQYGISSMGNAADIIEDSFLLEVIPGWLEFGRVDHVVHLALGTVLLLSAVLWKGATYQTVGRQIKRHMDGY